MIHACGESGQPTAIARVADGLADRIEILMHTLVAGPALQRA